MAIVDSDDEEANVPNESEVIFLIFSLHFPLLHNINELIYFTVSNKQSRKKGSNPRLRKRLSIRNNIDTSTVTSVSSNGVKVPENLPPPDPDQLKKIYSSCLDLFQAQVRCFFSKLLQLQ